MVILIMAGIGILLLCLGSNLGAFLLLPAIIAILFQIFKSICGKLDDQSRIEEINAQEQEKRRAEDARKQEAVEQQKKRIEQYKNSPLTKEVIRVICDGNPYTSYPEKIVITNDFIQGNRNGKTFTYDFSANRVHSFKQVIRTVLDNEDLKYIVRPQIAMAEALNFLLGNNYEIHDNAKRDVNLRTDCDGDTYATITYISDHVTMVLKSTLPNKHF